MHKRRYAFRIHGLATPPGQIRARDFSRALAALAKTAESATALLATGEGRHSRGAKPKWLAAATDFAITGLGPGSTSIAIDTPRLIDAPGSPFRQWNLWPEHIEIDPGDTALDLSARAIEEAQTPDSPGDLFDDSVLDAILDLARSITGDSVAYGLAAEGSREEEVRLQGDTAKRIAARKRTIPDPEGCIITGRIEQVAYAKRQFRLEPTSGPRLYGRLHPDINDVEILRSLWGRRATVQGSVLFKANGQPRFIEARHISESRSGDELFELLPDADSDAQIGDVTPRIRGATTTRPSELVGTWPGNETIEELLDALRSDRQ